MNQLFWIIGVIVAVVQFVCAVTLYDSGRKLMRSDNAFKREKGRCDISSAIQCIAIGIIIVVILLIFGRA